MILICGAVSEELSAVSSGLIDPADFHIGRRLVSRGMLAGMPVLVMETGIGVANAVQSITAVMETHPIELVLIMGCAGGFTASGVAIGDVVVASEEIDAHLGVEPQGNTSIPDRFPMPVLHAHNRDWHRRYPASGEWLTLALEQGASVGDRSGFMTIAGPCVTVGTVTSTDTRVQDMVDAWQPAAESMEGAGAAHVALHYGVDWLEIRGISNRVGQRDRHQWNIPLACAHATDVVIALIADMQPEGNNRCPIWP